ncbi:MAG: hypothetical protein PUA93_02695 [Eubacteriales bacterium]|nr:hypothetical protein [Eubacteriales bacterium]
MNQAFFSFIEFFMKEKVSTFNSFFRSKRRKEEKKVLFLALKENSEPDFLSFLILLIPQSVCSLRERKQKEFPFKKQKVPTPKNRHFPK